MSRSPRRRPGGKWVFVADTSEEALEKRKDAVMTMLNIGQTFGGAHRNPFAAIEQFHDYFPGEQKVPEGGSWIMVTRSPDTEYTVPPLSCWYAEPWPMNDHYGCCRVKIITPMGELGVFPREYSLLKEPEKYFEFVGKGMTAKFFGGEDGIPKDALFYLRSRGIGKRDAIVMLIGQIRSHGVLWLEADQQCAEYFGLDWPTKERLATI